MEANSRKLITAIPKISQQHGGRISSFPTAVSNPQSLRVTREATAGPTARASQSLQQGQPCPAHPTGSSCAKSPDHILAFPFLPGRTTPRWLGVGWFVSKSPLKPTAGSQNAEASLEENSISFPAAQHVSAEPQARSKLQAWSFWGTWHSRSPSYWR